MLFSSLFYLLAVGGSTLNNNNSNNKLDKEVVFKCGKVAKNPFGVASLTNCQSNLDGTLNERELKWLVRRAAGGFGIVNTCCVHVQENGIGWKGEWGIFNDKHTDGYRQVANAVHEHDALVIVQIFHGGMRADDSLFDGPARSCVDTVYKHRAGERIAKGLEESEIETLIQDFVKAAKRAEEAGCDGIEVHGAHGYILTQFLCPDLNTRTDQWGGKELENRARLLRKVVREIRQAVSPNFIVGVRLSPEPGVFEKDGWNMDPDENVQVAKWLAEDGVDYISVSLFGHCPTHIASSHRSNPDAKPLVQVFKEALPKDIVVMACGGIESGDDVKALLDLGVDVAACGRAAISTPDFPIQVLKNPKYQVGVKPPYTVDFLETVDVTPPFVGFLRTIGLVAQEEGLNAAKNDLMN